MPTRLLLADDHPVVLSGLKLILSAESDFEIVAVSTDGEEALREIRARKPDVAVLDLRMPRMDGLAVLREIAAESLPTRVVLLSAAINENEVIEALRHHIGGIVLKDLAPQVLVTCIRRVAAGGQWLEKESVTKALEKMVRREQGMQAIGSMLTPRELEVVKLVCLGMRNKDIAGKLCVTEGTVKVHLHSIYEKAGVNGRVELMVYARDRGII